MPYWESLKSHDVKVQKCSACGTLRYVPKEICHVCHSDEVSWASISGKGEIYTFSVVRRAPTPAYQEDVPYTIVHVTMDEGFRMIGTLSGIEVDDVAIGHKVKVAYDDVTPEWTLLTFVPA